MLQSLNSILAYTNHIYIHIHMQIFLYNGILRTLCLYIHIFYICKFVLLLNVIKISMLKLNKNQIFVSNFMIFYLTDTLMIQNVSELYEMHLIDAKCFMLLQSQDDLKSSSEFDYYFFFYFKFQLKSPFNFYLQALVLRHIEVWREMLMMISTI